MHTHVVATQYIGWLWMSSPRTFFGSRTIFVFRLFRKLKIASSAADIIPPILSSTVSKQEKNSNHDISESGTF